MKVAILSPVAWRTPPRNYGPWEQVASAITEGLAENNIDVTLFATTDSATKGKLEGVIPTGYEEDRDIDAKVAECLHISHLMERAGQFDIIHNNFDFLPLTYSALIKTPMVTTIHGFSSPRILPVFKKYNGRTSYVSISHSDRNPALNYIANVYNGIDQMQFTFNSDPDDFLLFFGRIHPDKGTWEAIQIARLAKKRLIISGIIQDRAYFNEKIMPHVNNDDVVYAGPSGPAERNHLMGKACALLHPINFEEPFGLSVAESMFCGTPVIAFRRGSMNELIDEGRTGFLVNTIEEAAGSVELVHGIRRSYCRQWAANHFSKERMVSDYIKVYHQVLNG